MTKLLVAAAFAIPLLTGLTGMGLLGGEAPRAVDVPSTVSVEPVAIATPPTLPEGVFAVIVVSDVRATLARIERAGTVLSPGSLPPGELARQFGSLLDDPALANLAAGGLLAVVGPGGVMPNIALIVPAREPTAYVAAAQRMGMQGDAVGSLAVLGRTPADLALGRRLAPDHGPLTASSTTRDLRLVLAPPRILAAYQPMLGGLTSMMAAKASEGQPDGRAAANVRLIIAGLPAAASDVEAIQIDVGLDGETLALDTAALAGSTTALARALVAPEATPATTSGLAARLGHEPGHLISAGRYDARGAAAWFTDLARRLRQQPDGREAISEPDLALYQELNENLTGAFAFRMRAISEVRAQVEAAYGIRDATRQIALNRRWFTGWQTGPQPMPGIQVIYTEAARSVAGTRVDRIDYAIDPEQATAKAKELAARLPQATDVAVVEHAVLLANRPDALDRLVAGGTPATITAERAIGPGRDGYVDCDPLAMGRTMTNVQSAVTAKALAEVRSEPFVGAWTARDGRLLLEARIPLRQFFDFARAIAPPAEDGQSSF